MKSKRTSQAFTLVELLIVVAIITILAALSLPSIKSMMSGQKVTQASNSVQAHIQSARARAVASGRKVAAVLEIGLSGNSVIALSFGQEFPPYQGDLPDSTGMLADMNNDGFYDRINISQLDGSLAFQTPTVYGVGDFVQVGNNQTIFAITAVNINTQANPNIAQIDFQNPPMAVVSNGNSVQTAASQLPTSINPISRFKITRKPAKSFVPPTMLPRGTCIDLTSSGMGLTGIEFSSYTNPIMIVFDERGSLAYIADGTGAQSRPTGVVHLLVGRIEQTSTTQLVKIETEPSSINSNINDNENVWISINPYSGNVYSSPLAAGSEGSSGRLAVARSFATNVVPRSQE